MKERFAFRLTTLAFLGIVPAFVALQGAAADGDADNPIDTTKSETGRLVVVIRGASGTPEYGEQFDAWSHHWESAATKGLTRFRRIGPHESAGDLQPDSAKVQPDADRKLIQQTLNDAAVLARKKQLSELWIVLIGHGTFDGRQARFNLRGEDISSEELADWLSPVSCQIAIANCSSASGPFLKALTSPGRVVITATRSGAEINFARFGRYLSEAIGDPKFDLDKDGQTSLLEAFLSASRRTDAFYESEARLATEHSLLDDNGDGLGIRASFFRGIRRVEKVEGPAVADGQTAHSLHLVRSDSEQRLSPETRKLRDSLELTVTRLRDRRQEFKNEDEYYAELERVLVDLARVYEDSAAESSSE